MPESAVTAPEVGIYVYGVVPADQQRPSLKGLDDVEVEYVEQGPLAAAVSELVLDRPPGRRAELMAHTRVIDALAEVGTVVPVQFGSVMAERGDVLEGLLDEERTAAYAGLVDQLRGRSQFTLRATYVVDQVLSELVSQRPDIAELRERTRDLPGGTPDPDLVRLGELVSQALEPVREQDSAQILGVVDPFVAAGSERAGGGVDHVLDVALLVDDERAGQLEQALETLAEAVHERIHLSLSGPMAPYDFTSELPGGAEGSAWA